jgi:hypothetical protein
VVVAGDRESGVNRCSRPRHRFSSFVLDQFVRHFDDENEEEAGVGMKKGN